MKEYSPAKCVSRVSKFQGFRSFATIDDGWYQGRWSRSANGGGEAVRYRGRHTRCWVLLVLASCAGCHSMFTTSDTPSVTAHLVEREMATAADLHPETYSLDAVLADGLTEDEAAALALRNNAAFLELLVDVGLAQSDLIAAGLLPNPEFVGFANVTDKPYKYALEVPIEALWLRPIRMAAATKDVERATQRVTQAGLDLLRDVRQAYADVLLAQERVRIAKEAVTLRGRIAELAEKRFKAGDVSEQEAATARIDALQATQDATRLQYEIPVAEERLRNVLGLGEERPTLTLAPRPAPYYQTFDLTALLNDAKQHRPDALAAQEAIAAAEARLQFAQLGWVRLLGVADATSGKNGHQLGPALRFTVPLFNQNQGGIARAEAELERAKRNQQTVANQIILDVQRASLQYRQASAELEVLRTKVRPEVDAAIRRAQAAYLEGNATIFIVLETTRQLLDNYLRDAQLQADLRRFWAELERSVGRRLRILPVPPTPARDPLPDAPRPASFASDREQP